MRTKLPAIARVLRRIDKEGPTSDLRPDLGPCWVWEGAVTGKWGYGVIGVERKSLDSWAYRLDSVHRVVYEALVGPIPDGLEIDHLCRNVRCCNPAHLEAVTHAVNMKRSTAPEKSAARNRAKTHCVHGHIFDDENTHFNVRGHRECWTCLEGRGRVRH